MSEIQEQQPQSTEVTSKLTEELQIINSENQILVAGTPEYTAAEQQKMNEVDPVTRVVEKRYHNKQGQEAVLIGTEHIFDPDHPEAEYLKGVIDAIPEGSNKVLILEGQYQDSTTRPADPREAITVGGGEFNYMRVLGEQQGIEVVPAEPDPHDSANNILKERPDITRDEVALHYALKVLQGVVKQGEPARLEDVAVYIHHAAGMAGDKSEGGWVDVSTSRDEVLNMNETQKKAVVGEMPGIITKLNEEFSKVYPNQKLLELQPDGTVTLLYDLFAQPVPWDPSEDTVIAEISRMDMLMRDRHTFELTMQALEQGKEPIVAVGSSHVSTLQPAFEAQLQAA